MELDWPVDETFLPPLGSGDEDDDALMAQRATAKALAIQVMYVLSARQFGIFDVIARPCIDDYHRRHTGSRVTSYVLSWEGDKWVNWWCGCSGRCRISGPGAVHLPGPALEVMEVNIAGAVLAEDQYRLENNTLYRVGDIAVWPRQDLSRPVGSPNTWSVEYLRGQPVPDGVAALTGILAGEFFKAVRGDSKCRLPRNVTQVSRQGVSYSVFNPEAIYNARKTGIYEIDLWLSAVNPNGLMAAPTVM